MQYLDRRDITKEEATRLVQQDIANELYYLIKGEYSHDSYILISFVREGWDLILEELGGKLPYW